MPEIPGSPSDDNTQDRPAVDDLAERLAYLNLDARDAQRLREIRGAFREFLPQFVEAFYAHLFDFDVTASLLQDPELVERLKSAQRAHLDSILSGEWTLEYVQQRHRVGQAHAEVGLEPQWFLGAYNLYVQHSLRHFAETLGPEEQQSLSNLMSLLKVIFLDVGLTLDAYFGRATENLQQALDMYWRANQELRRFAQLASHDMKTPLATVANLCDEALDEFSDQMPDEAAELIRSARQRVFKTSAMIDDLLQSTLSANHEDARTRVSTFEIISEALDRLRPAIDDKEVDVQLRSELPVVWGNKARLQEAFYNLLANAVKFIDQRPGRIVIRAESEGGHCLISIEDNGPGIPEGELQRIFIPFRRLRRHRDRPGTGLGLYFTSHIIEGEGGSVWAESAGDTGSRFCISLPRATGRDR